MRESVEQRQTRLAREKALYQYMSALEAGDLEAIALILQAAERDAALEQQIFELHAPLLQEEEGQVPLGVADRGEQPLVDTSDQHQPSIIPSPRPHQHRHSLLRPWGSAFQKLVAILLVGLLLSSFLALYISRSGSSSAPVVVVVSLNNDIYAFRPDDGAPLWVFHTGHPISGSAMLVQGSTVFAADSDGSVYALRAQDGKLLWQQQVNPNPAEPIYGGNGSWTNIAADGNVVVVGYLPDYPLGERNLVAAFDPHSGHLLWQQEYLPTTDDSNPLLGLGNHAVYVHAVSTVGHQTEALRETDGALLWSSSHFLYWIAPNAQAASQVVYSGVLYGVGDQLQALNAQTGALIWQQNELIPEGPIVVGNGLIYANGPGGDQLCAYQMSDGHQVWCVQGVLDNRLNYTEANFPLLAIDGTLYVRNFVQRFEGRPVVTKITSTYTIQAWGAGTGQKHWSWPPATSRLLWNGGSGLAGVKGILYAATSEGLCAVQGSDGHQLWCASLPTPGQTPQVVAVG